MIVTACKSPLYGLLYIYDNIKKDQFRPCLIIVYRKIVNVVCLYNIQRKDWNVVMTQTVGVPKHQVHLLRYHNCIGSAGSHH